MSTESWVRRAAIQAATFARRRADLAREHREPEAAERYERLATDASRLVSRLDPPRRGDLGVPRPPAP